MAMPAAARCLACVAGCGNDSSLRLTSLTGLSRSAAVRGELTCRRENGIALEAAVRLALKLGGRLIAQGGVAALEPGLCDGGGVAGGDEVCGGEGDVESVEDGLVGEGCGAVDLPVDRVGGVDPGHVRDEFRAE